MAGGGSPSRMTSRVESRRGQTRRERPETPRADDKLRHEIAAWLTTVTADGQPQATPIWFHWDGSTFLFYSQPGRPKLANIAANPKVSLHLVGDPEGEDVVTVEGVASLDPAAPSLEALPSIRREVSLGDRGVRLDAREHGRRLLRCDPGETDSFPRPVMTGPCSS